MSSVLVIVAAIFAVALLALSIGILTTVRFKDSNLKRYIIKRSTWRLLISVICLLAVILIAFWIANIIAPGATNAILPEGGQGGNPAALILLISATLASIGWIFSTYVQERNLAKDLAFRFVNQIFHDPTMERHKINISRKYPVGVNVQAGELVELEAEFKNGALYNGTQIPIYYSIVYILNTYEQIATGVLNDKLDEEVMREHVGKLMQRAIAVKFRAVIQKLRSPGPTGNRPETFNAISELMKRWYNIDLDR